MKKKVRLRESAIDTMLKAQKVLIEYPDGCRNHVDCYRCLLCMLTKANTGTSSIKKRIENNIGDMLKGCDIYVEGGTLTINKIYKATRKEKEILEITKEVICKL